MYQTNASVGLGTAQGTDEGLRAHMLGVYNRMTAALGISAVVASSIAWTGVGSAFIVETRHGIGLTGLGTVGMFAPLAMLLVAMFTRPQTWSPSSTKVFFWTFAALQGIGLSLAFKMHGGVDVTRALFLTTGAFAGLSIWGYTTKRNLDAVGTFCMMGLWGLVLTSLVGMLFGFSLGEGAMAVLTILVFAGLTAWNTQKLKAQYYAIGDADDASRATTWGALSLYLDFLNIFMAVLRLER